MKHRFPFFRIHRFCYALLSVLIANSMSAGTGNSGESPSTWVVDENGLQKESPWKCVSMIGEKKAWKEQVRTLQPLPKEGLPEAKWDSETSELRLTNEWPHPPRNAPIREAVLMFTCPRSGTYDLAALAADRDIRLADRHASRKLEIVRGRDDGTFEVIEKHPIRDNGPTVRVFRTLSLEQGDRLFVYTPWRGGPDTFAVNTVGVWAAIRRVKKGASNPTALYETFRPPCADLKSVQFPRTRYVGDTVEVTLTFENLFSRNVPVTYEIAASSGKTSYLQETKTVDVPAKSTRKVTVRFVPLTTTVDEENGVFGDSNYSLKIDGRPVGHGTFFVLPDILLERLDAEKKAYTEDEPLWVQAVLSNQTDRPAKGCLTWRKVLPDETGEFLRENIPVDVPANQTVYEPLHVGPRGKTRWIECELTWSNLPGRRMRRRIRVEPHQNPVLRDEPNAVISGQGLPQHEEHLRLFRDMCPYIRQYDQAGGLPPEVCRWAHQQGLFAGVGVHTGFHPSLAAVGPDGRSATECNADPAHMEDMTLFRQAVHARRAAQGTLGTGAETIYLCEPSFCYWGDFGPYAAVYGYSEEAVRAYRRALQGKDAGFRWLIDENRYVTMHFPDLWKLWYARELPSPKRLGLESWEPYTPIPIRKEYFQGDGLENDATLLRARIHLAMCVYFSLYQLDLFFQYLYNHVPDPQLLPNPDYVVGANWRCGQWRLPYVQTHSEELFNSAYDHAVVSQNEGGWAGRDVRRFLGKRRRLIQEIGHGGNAVPYRAPVASLAGVYAMTAGRRYPQLQVDFYHPDHFQGMRRKELLAMYRAFGLAHEQQARFPGGDPTLLIAWYNRHYDPSVMRIHASWSDSLAGRRIWKNQEVVGFGILNRRNVPFDAAQLPLFHQDPMDRYRTIVLAGPRYTNGTLSHLRRWLDASSSPPRTLMINHVSLFQADFRKGLAPENVRWSSVASSPWKTLGIPAGKPAYAKSRGFHVPEGSPLACSSIEKKLSLPLGIFLVPPPNGARVWLEDEKRRPVVWRYPSEGNGVVYSGLPFELLVVRDDRKQFLENAMRAIFDAMGHKGHVTTTPESLFAGVYVTRSGEWTLSVIRESERGISGSPSYAFRTDEDLKASIRSAERSEPVEITIRELPANRVFRLNDITSGREITRGKSDSGGVLQLRFRVPLAGLYILRDISPKSSSVFPETKGE